MLTPVKIYGNEREVFPCGAVKICDKECVKKNKKAMGSWISKA